MAVSGGELERAREAYAEQAWTEAFEGLSKADGVESLGADDLELLAEAAYMLGREAEYLATLERAHRARRDDGEPMAALRCAFWVGINLARRGELGQASGWLGRAQRLLDGEGGDRVERGYLILPRVFEEEASGELEAAAATAAEVAAIGERFGDPDLFALAAHEQGHILIKVGRIKEGLALLDETMVAVAAGELSPIVSGIVYCGVILACRDAHEVRRATEWTAALSAWCSRQPDLVAFTGRCLLHRAELMQSRGAWSEALLEAQRACRRCEEGENPAAAGEAEYRRGEIERLLGEFETAERAYREASRRGREPQPGLALLRMAQGDREGASVALGRALSEATETGGRLSLLPAQVEISLAVGDLDAARAACRELEAIAASDDGALAATAAQAQGIVALALGDPPDALAALRRAENIWRELKFPYEMARVREQVGLACRALGDEETARLELEASSSAYADLGATPDSSRVESLLERQPEGDSVLTKRELEVLWHLASGETNKEIAAELVLSERTVDRHVSNLFAKLGVSNRAAATAYAYEHHLLADAGLRPPNFGPDPKMGDSADAERGGRA
jgi:DNA-binding CsgD family transcriptional regulator